MTEQELNEKLVSDKVVEGILGDMEDTVKWKRCRNCGRFYYPGYTECYYCLRDLI